MKKRLAIATQIMCKYIENMVIYKDKFERIEEIDNYVKLSFEIADRIKLYSHIHKYNEVDNTEG